MYDQIAANIVSEIRALKEENERLRQAIEWALGVIGDFKPRAEGQGGYWWRHELQERAGLEWDDEKFVGVDAQRIFSKLKCLECDGTGYVEYPILKIDYTTMDFTCPECQGTGKKK